jgi:hypothetical protein
MPCLRTTFKLKKVFAQTQICYIFAAPIGGLAQLARVLAWHARGHRFESDILHKEWQPFKAPQIGPIAQLVRAPDS